MAAERFKNWLRKNENIKAVSLMIMEQVSIFQNNLKYYPEKDRE